MAIDNSASRCAVERGASVNLLGAEKIDSCLAVCRKNECPLRTVPIPGHYNVADWPSHLQKIRPGTNVYKSNKAGKQFETVFDPFQKSWEIMSDAYRGLRMKLELLEREGPWTWEEYEDRRTGRRGEGRVRRQFADDGVGRVGVGRGFGRAI